MENKTIIEKAIKFIQANPAANLSLQEIADHAGFSLTYFDAMFRANTGYSPIEYSRIYKLTRSALALRKTQKNILDIALDYGYASPESYTRAFKSFYSITPSEYRTKYSGKAISWKDISGRIAINHFVQNYPELNPVHIDTALDFCFTHNPLFFAEDIINITVGDTAVFTLDDPEALSHFIYVSDYNDSQASVDIVCDNESDAISYLKLLTKHEKIRFSIRKPLFEEWETFDEETTKLGLFCRTGYDMIYLGKTVELPQIPENIMIRELTIDDIPLLTDFKNKGGCTPGHANSLKLALERKANLGERGFGLFLNNELSGLALPVLDEIRNLKKYDVGAILMLPYINENEIFRLLWKYIINFCLSQNALLGNANAKEDGTSISISVSESVGLTKIAKSCIYTK